MFAPFAEAVRATPQPCNWLLVVLPLVVVGVTGGRWRPALGVIIGVIVGGWLFIAGHQIVDARSLQLTGALAIATICLLLVPVVAPAAKPSPLLADDRVRTGIALFIGLASTMWWRPCVGSELGQILSAAPKGLVGQLPAITAYMIGAMMPVVLFALVLNVIGETPRARGVAYVAGGIGLVTSFSLLLGPHEMLVDALARWTTTT
jgi:cytochrome c biogenesis protein CcdA